MVSGLHLMPAAEWLIVGPIYFNYTIKRIMGVLLAFAFHIWFIMAGIQKFYAMLSVSTKIDLLLNFRWEHVINLDSCVHRLKRKSIQTLLRHKILKWKS